MHFYTHFVVFGGGTSPGEGRRRIGRRPSGPEGILHLGVWSVVFLFVFAHSAQVLAKRPRDSHLSDLSQVTLQVPLGSCTGNFKKARHWHKAAPHAGDGAKVASSRGGFKGLRLPPTPLVYNFAL